MADLTSFPIAFSRPMRAMAVLGIAPGNSALVVGGDELTCRMGAGGWAFRATVPLAAVEAVERADRRVWSWGVHGWRGRWLVNGSSRGIVVARFDPPGRARVLGVPVRLRELWVSVDDPEGVAAALGHPLV